MNAAGLREFNFASMVFRLVLALLVGALVGYGRARKQRNAGLRTYILTCVGAALTVLISLYEYRMLTAGSWAAAQAYEDLKFDLTRFSAGVISGIGFLAAGTIVATAHQQVSGLTSAIGLFTTACLGIAAGAGFYECVLAAVILVVVAIELLQPLEVLYKRRLRNITISVEFSSIDDIGTITDTITGMDAQIFDIDVETEKPEDGQWPSAIMTLKLSRENASHSAMLSSVAELPCVRSVLELIS